MVVAQQVEVHRLIHPARQLHYGVAKNVRMMQVAKDISHNPALIFVGPVHSLDMCVLAVAVSSQDGNRRLINEHRSHAALGLGILEYRPLRPRDYAGLHDPDLAVGKVDILPAQGRNFPPSHAGRSG